MTNFTIQIYKRVVTQLQILVRMVIKIKFYLRIHQVQSTLELQQLKYRIILGHMITHTILYYHMYLHLKTQVYME